MPALRLSRTVVLPGAALLSAGWAAGCRTDAYCFDCPLDPSFSLDGGSGDGGTGGIFNFDGGPGGDADAGFADADACDADTGSDPRNCGECGHVCELSGAFPRCENGECAIDQCAEGRHDLNGLAADGCEYACLTANGGVEACNGKDDDCDGEVDEGFDLEADPSNCGACGAECELPNAVAGCAVVAGIARCVVDACDDGWSDPNQLASDGCEYQCPVNPPVAEICNGLDDDCDGEINEGNPGGGLPCPETCPGGVCLGECTPGTTLCSGSSLVCVPGTGPGPETCNQKDDDCDGTTDDGFDLATDPLNCGQCGKLCTLLHAVGGCNGGTCVITTCLPGYASIDGNPDNGCEYPCPVDPPVTESCNGKDDDCNGVVDDPAVIAAQKPDASGCNPQPGTPCAGADFACTGQTGWRCAYGPDVEIDGTGRLLIVEMQCNGKDGNCNGQIDESWVDLGQDCDNGLSGACRDGGKRVCDPADPTQTTCDLGLPPDPTPGAPFPEACNGVDDDCNGSSDDGIVDDMVVVQRSGLSYRIDRHEASRPDATATNAGLLETRRCVTAGVLPWTQATKAEAAAACAVTGHRLCTAEELEVACGGPGATAYPYGASYVATACNGLDWDGVPGSPDDNVLLATGSLAQCVTPDGIFDLSGNAIEWSSTVTGNTGPPNNLDILIAKGGSFLTSAPGLACAFTLSRFGANAILPELGFRCCRDEP
jgi:hypothetical protein